MRYAHCTSIPYRTEGNSVLCHLSNKKEEELEKRVLLMKEEDGQPVAPVEIVAM